MQSALVDPTVTRIDVAAAIQMLESQLSQLAELLSDFADERDQIASLYEGV